jgi:hypothetical protein
MPWVIMAQYKDGGVDVYRPRFLVTTSREDALELSARLNKAASLSWMTVEYPYERRGEDHAQWADAGLDSLQAMDPSAVARSHYTAWQVEEYTGPHEDVTPVFQALMAAYAANSANPPTSPHEAIFRLIRDGATPPPPEPPPESPPEPPPEPPP